MLEVNCPRCEELMREYRFLSCELDGLTEKLNDAAQLELDLFMVVWERAYAVQMKCHDARKIILKHLAKHRVKALSSEFSPPS